MNKEFKNLENKTMFIGIGAQKTGTTWLADYLSSHEQVCFSPIKELHYFNTKYLNVNFDKIFIKKLHQCVLNIATSTDKLRIKKAQLLLKRLEMHNNDKAYMQYFNDLINSEKVFGEITPAYSMLDSNGFKAIREIHPKVKFIFMMRNPIDRFWSQLRYKTIINDKSFQPLASFEEKLADEQFLKRTDYKRTIESLISVVDNKDILYLFYEDLFSKEKGEETVRKVTDFLEIDYVEPDFGKSINVSKPIKLDAHLKELALDKFGYIIEFVDQFFDGDIPKNWKLL